MYIYWYVRFIKVFSYSKKQIKKSIMQTTNSDHNLIIIKCSLKFKKINKLSKKYYKQNLKK